MTNFDAAYFDEWYANIGESTQQQAIQNSHLGLPAELESTSLLPWDGIADVVTALGLEAGVAFVDLACGRGGYGLEVARRTRARLVGVDFAAVAIERARTKHSQSWSDVHADFRVGTLTATGLPDASAAGVLCVDGMQFADPYPDAVRECLRILVPGGRFVLTGWEPRTAGDATIGARLRRDIGASVTRAGFTDVRVTEMAAWQRTERAMWEVAVASEPDGDAAMDSMRAEGIRTLAAIQRLRRVLVTATAPRP